MNFFAALKIHIQRLRGNIFWPPAVINEYRLLQLEALVVGNKNQLAILRQQIQSVTNQLHLIALHIQGVVHALGIGKGGWIQINKIELLIRFFQPLQTICC